MQKLFKSRDLRTAVALSASFLVPFTAAFAVGPNTRTFGDGENGKVEGVILSRSGSVLKVRGDDDSVGTVDLTDGTKIQLKRGILRRKSAMSTDALVSGLRVQAEGRGNDKGELVAEKITFDPNSMKASRAIDTRVSPLESRTDGLESKTNGLESRTGRVEGRQGELEQQQTKTNEKVGEVASLADQANKGVSSVNDRVNNLDNLQQKYKETVYFKLNSSQLDPSEQQKLDTVIAQTKGEKGYAIEVAGFADKTGNINLNQALSEKRASAVVRYLEQQGSIPIHRILTPAGMGITHEAADNSTAEGRKLNRRVEVTVLINQGVVAGSTSSTSAPAPAADAAAPKPPSPQN
jgi:OmpA-OmpF porin, OOP family